VQTATSTPIFVVLNGELPTPALTPTPTGTPHFIPSELIGKIVFLSDRAHHANAGTERREGEEALPLGEPLVYVINPDGSNLALLTDRWPYDLALAREAFSADQRFRVFVKDALINTGKEVGGDIIPIQLRVPALFIFDFYYEVEEQLTHFGIDDGHQPLAYDPAWCPTCERVAFVTTETGNDEIWVINRDGDNAHQLTRDDYSWWDKHPSWSPDGSKIVFWSNRTGSRGIWVMNADGSDAYCLSRTGFNDWDPVWIKYTDPPRPLPTPPPR
jgi:dipeptidyl aminopeptidase/acylaminoacyl peptidase